MGKRLTAISAAAAIGIGGLTVAAINPIGMAGAQDTTSTTAPPAGGARTPRSGPLERALKDLVADGTLTEAQAAKVKEAVTSEAKAGHQKRKDRRADVLQVAAEAIGSTPDEVKAGLKDGTSIADQAEANGVDRQVVDEALTKAITARIEAAVKAGTVTADQGAKATARVDKVVDRILDADGTKGRRGN